MYCKVGWLKFNGTFDAYLGYNYHAFILIIYRNNRHTVNMNVHKLGNMQFSAKVAL